ncbi:conserved oligomeric Golgi complex subunit 4 [Halyomorpha halys]|uniref:conserved oligomeric Golgi complex subunit 4 n=1 Tax=Halyomorpha halys TaxID=286706 RepID=UPI0006D4E63B|nr:conserved oligomeric Golgi complex subunit 4 [Halyomorpha halys]
MESSQIGEFNFTSQLKFSLQDLTAQEDSSESSDEFSPENEFLTEEHQKLYTQLTQKENEVENELEKLLSRHCHLETKIRGITKVLPNLEIIHSDAKQLYEMISFASTLAENVSHKVRKLDIARSRVSECQQRVHDLLDLQLCCDGVQTSMNSGDFEKAAAHIHRYLAMDQSLLEKTADDVHQDSKSVNNSISLLKEAAVKIQEILTSKFNDAVAKQDSNSVERFFKLFPLLGMHDYGIEKFSDYLVDKVETSSRKHLKTASETSLTDKRAAVLYSDLLTHLFEDIARTIETHQPLVETYYGPGRLLKLVCRLQDECDRASQVILSEMWRSRGLEKLTSSIKSGTHKSRGDPKEFDQLLGELAIAHSRYSLYLHFLRRKISMDTEEEKQPTVLAALEDKLKSCVLCRTMEELLSAYLILEHHYMEESVRKAIAMDTIEASSQFSSMIDDVFFIVKKSIRRASSTGSIDGVCAVINNACGVLENEMCTKLNATLKQGYPTGYLDLAQAYSMIHARLQPSDTEQAKSLFIAHLNNTEVGSEYVTTLASGLAQEVQCPTQTDRSKLEGCLSGLSSVCAAMGMAQDLGLQQLANAAIKPRLAPWIDSFLALSHNLTEEEFSSYEANEPFVRSLIANIDGILSEFRASLTSGNFESLVTFVADEVNSQMERVIMKMEFNRLGGLALEREVRALTGYLNSTTSMTIRERLARLGQVAKLLNMEKINEISEIWTRFNWRLAPGEVKKVLKLRVDFPKEEIMKLKL